MGWSLGCTILVRDSLVNVAKLFLHLLLVNHIHQQDIVMQNVNVSRVNLDISNFRMIFGYYESCYDDVL